MEGKFFFEMEDIVWEPDRNDVPGLASVYRIGRERNHGSFTFAVIWDEDHDSRIFHAVDQLHCGDFSSCILCFYEHEGTLDLLLKRTDNEPGLEFSGFPEYLEILDDIWHVGSNYMGMYSRFAEGIANLCRMRGLDQQFRIN